jgi:hypothetical protein
MPLSKEARRVIDELSQDLLSEHRGMGLVGSFVIDFIVKRTRLAWF